MTRAETLEKIAFYVYLLMERIQEGNKNAIYYNFGKVDLLTHSLTKPISSKEKAFLDSRYCQLKQDNKHPKMEKMPTTILEAINENNKLYINLNMERSKNGYYKISK